MGIKRYELSDSQRLRGKPLLLGKATDRGRTGVDNRLFVNGCLWVLRSGAHWHDCPSVTVGGRACSRRFSRWCHAGVWERGFEMLTKAKDNSYLMIERTIVRAHQQAACGKGGSEQAMGRSRGGLTTKIHLLADALGRPIKVLITAGQTHDSTAALPFLQGQKTQAVLADKAYDSNELRECIAQMGAQAVIPSKRNRKQPIAHETQHYKQRNRIERCFNKLKLWRRFSTRYDRKTLHLYDFSLLTASTLWLK